MKTSKRSIALLFLIAFVASVFTVSVSADMGPKPSVVVTFENMPEGKCYGTLLSSRQSTGPYSIYDGTKESERDTALDYPEAWRTFVDFSDEDGYYFLQTVWEVSLHKSIKWKYYPPERFKILLWYPDSGVFYESGIINKYAFDSYYTVDMAEAEGEGIIRITERKSYDYTNEILSLLARIAATMAIEICVALLFNLRTKKALLVILAVNAVTQISLNVALNIISFYSGGLYTMFWYFLLEPLIIVFEAAVYSVLLPRRAKKTHRAWFFIIYAVIANALSFASGFLIEYLIPAIF